jgi:hypothetical protein
MRLGEEGGRALGVERVYAEPGDRSVPLDVAEHAAGAGPRRMNILLVIYLTDFFFILGFF